MDKTLDELVRDLTKVGSIPKSEARRRIQDYVSSKLSLLAKEVEGVRRKIKPGSHLLNPDFDFTEEDVDMAHNGAVNEVLSLINKYRKG